MDWQAIVRKEARSRSNFTLTTWTDYKVHCEGVRLTCTCCGAWAQYLITEEMLTRAYYPEQVYEEVLIMLTRWLLAVNPTGGAIADRRTITGSGTNT